MRSGSASRLEWEEAIRDAEGLRRPVIWREEKMSGAVLASRYPERRSGKMLQPTPASVNWPRLRRRISLDSGASLLRLTRDVRFRR